MGGGAMSMNGRWDLEEAVEDAIVAYVRKATGELAMVIPSRTIAEARYPLVVIDAGSSDNASVSNQGTTPFTGRRSMAVTVAIVTEAINFPADDEVRTARDHHRAVKSPIIAALAGNTVHEDLNALAMPGVLFSQCHMTAQSRDQGDGRIVTEQTLDVIAQPRA